MAELERRSSKTGERAQIKPVVSFLAPIYVSPRDKGWIQPDSVDAMQVREDDDARP